MDNATDPQQLDREQRIRDYAAAYRAANRAKLAEYNRLWRAANPTKLAEYKRRWKAANPEKVKAQRARERAKPGYRQLASAASLRWYYNNKERAAASKQRRNLDRASGSWSPGRVQVAADQREHHRQLARGLSPSELLGLVDAAIPRLPSRDARQEARSELVLAVLDGLVALEDLARAGKRYADHIYVQTRIKFVSLDDRVPGSENRLFHEVIADSSGSE